MDDNKKKILKEIEEHEGELVLDLFEVVKLVGFGEDEDDYYYRYLSLDRGLYRSSCVLGFMSLKGKLDDDNYKRLESIWKLNEKSYETIKRINPKINIIVACDASRGIGRNGEIPWHLPADLRRFKMLTEGKVVIMGRKTYESIGKALPNRINIVVSRNTEYSLEDALVTRSVDDALVAARIHGRGNEIFIIGGGEIYEQSIEFADTIYMTLISKIYEGCDTFFPEITNKEWKKTSVENCFSYDKSVGEYYYSIYNKIKHILPILP